MKTTFLDFEQPVAELESKIEDLRFVQDDSAVDISEEIRRLRKKSDSVTKEIYAKLSAWQISQVARHPQRPYTMDYIESLFSGFEEIHGDRLFADDPSVIGGIARFNDSSEKQKTEHKKKDRERTHMTRICARGGGVCANV